MAEVTAISFEIFTNSTTKVFFDRIHSPNYWQKKEMQYSLQWDAFLDQANPSTSSVSNFLIGLDPLCWGCMTWPDHMNRQIILTHSIIVGPSFQTILPTPTSNPLVPLPLVDIWSWRSWQKPDCHCYINVHRPCCRAQLIHACGAKFQQGLGIWWGHGRQWPKDNPDWVWTATMFVASYYELCLFRPFSTRKWE